MPQASEADRKRYQERFGDIGPEHAVEELKKRGFHLRRDWTWDGPDRRMTEEESFLIGFLIREWDFGGCNDPDERREYGGEARGSTARRPSYER